MGHVAGEQRVDECEGERRLKGKTEGEPAGKGNRKSCYKVLGTGLHRFRRVLEQ